MSHIHWTATGIASISQTHTLISLKTTPPPPPFGNFGPILITSLMHLFNYFHHIRICTFSLITVCIFELQLELLMLHWIFCTQPNRTPLFQMLEAAHTTQPSTTDARFKYIIVHLQSSLRHLALSRIPLLHCGLHLRPGCHAGHLIYSCLLLKRCQLWPWPNLTCCTCNWTIFFTQPRPCVLIFTQPRPRFLTSASSFCSLETRANPWS